MTEDFTVDGDPHDVGDPNCAACWHGYPRSHECGGLLHAAFGDENSDCEYWLHYRCDVCGDTDND